MLAEGSSSFDIADSTRIGKLALQQSRQAWIDALIGSNDDAGVSGLVNWHEVIFDDLGLESGSSSPCGRSVTTGSTAVRMPLRTSYVASRSSLAHRPR